MNANGFRDGVKSALPIVLGYLPVGITFGILARKAGLTAFEVGLMSLFVYAGASQFLAIEMISKGISNFPIILATFFINLRHILMSSNFSVYLRNVRIPTLGLLSAQMTDESYAVAISRLPRVKNRPHYLLGLQIISQLAWVGGSVMGHSSVRWRRVRAGVFPLPYRLSSSAFWFFKSKTLTTSGSW
jgi:4-azaleucine resistance transporter AzlC